MKEKFNNLLRENEELKDIKEIKDLVQNDLCIDSV